MAFLQHCYDETQSLPVVYQRLSSFSYFYRLKGLASPSAHPSVLMYMKGLKRCQAEKNSQVRRAKPLTKIVLRQMNEYLWSGSRTLREWRTVWRVNLAFYGLLRWDDVKRLKVSFPSLFKLLSRSFYRF